MWWKITLDRDDAVLMIATLVSAAANFARFVLNQPGCTGFLGQSIKSHSNVNRARIACLGALQAANRKFVSVRCALHHSNN
jgi:hypothetical protein